MGLEAKVGLNWTIKNPTLAVRGMIL